MGIVAFSVLHATLILQLFMQICYGEFHSEEGIIDATLWDIPFADPEIIKENGHVKLATIDFTNESKIFVKVGKVMQYNFSRI